MRTLSTLACAATLLLGTASANAALVNRGGGMIYDTVLNVTWLADMNYAKTQYIGTSGAQGDSDGKMNWSDATTWANSLIYGGHDDWTLASLDQLAHLFATDLGNKSGESVLTTIGDTAEQIANLALFSNVQSDAYWSSEEYTPGHPQAYHVYTNYGDQSSTNFKWVGMYAAAVRPGDVATAVPEPQTWALTLLALGAAWGARRQRTR